MFYLEIKQSNQNQNVRRIENEYWEIFRNEIFMEPLVKASKEYLSLQTKISSIYENMQVNIEKLHVQKIFWKPHNITLC
jgi:hypothetical protein